MEEFFKLWDSLVPQFGQAATLQGEIIRATGNLADEYLVNGCGNWDAGFEHFVAFLDRYLADGTFGPQTTAGIHTDLAQVQAYGRREDTQGFDLEAAFERLHLAAVGWCERHPQPIPNTPDPNLNR